MGAHHKKERRKAKDARREAARRMLRSSSGLPPDTPIVMSKDSKKMSEILVEFAEPLFEITDDEEKAYKFAMIAWNASLLPREELAKSLETVVGEVSADDPQAGAAIKVMLAGMILRKLERYPDNRRTILGFEFTGSGENRVFNVLSTPPR